jgi:hypothetical protein
MSDLSQQATEYVDAHTELYKRYAQIMGAKVAEVLPKPEQETPEQKRERLRDYFAAKAMQGMMAQAYLGQDGRDGWCGWGEACANDLNEHGSATAMTLAKFSYRVADAMLKARET